MSSSISVRFRNLQPLWRPAGGGSWLIGTAWVFGNAPMMFNSFQSVLQAIEERTRTLSKEVVVRLCHRVRFVGDDLLSADCRSRRQATPWARARLERSGRRRRARPSAMVQGAEDGVFLLALAASLLKSWNPVFMTTVRLLLAQAREGMIPASLAA